MARGKQLNKSKEGYRIYIKDELKSFKPPVEEKVVLKNIIEQLVAGDNKYISIAKQYNIPVIDINNKIDFYPSNNFIFEGVFTSKSINLDKLEFIAICLGFFKYNDWLQNNKHTPAQLDNNHSIDLLKSEQEFLFKPFSELHKSINLLHDPRNEEINILSSVNDSFILFHGLPQIGKTTLLLNWLNQLNNTKVLLIECREIQKYFISDLFEETGELIDLIKAQSNEQFVLAFEDFEVLINEKRQIAKDFNNVRELLKTLNNANLSNLKVYINSRFDVDFTIPNLKIFRYELLGYKNEAIINRFKGIGIQQNSIERLIAFYKGHPLLLERAFELLQTKESTIESLLENKNDVYIILKNEIDSLFEKLDTELHKTFFRIVLLEEVPTNVNSEHLSKLSKYHLVNIENNTIHSFITTLAQDFFKDNVNFKAIGKSIINEYVQKSNDCDWQTKNEVLFKALRCLLLINESVDNFPDIQSFVESLSQNEKNLYFILDLNKSAEKTLDRLSFLKQILKEDYYLYKSIYLRLNGSFANSKNEIETYRAEKLAKNCFDDLAQYHYYNQLGSIQKITGKIDEAIDCYKKCLLKRDKEKLILASQKELSGSLKKEVKTFLTPVIDLANIYLSKERNIEDNDGVKDATDLLLNEYIFFEQKKIPLNSAFFNKLADIFYKTDNYKKALEFYLKAYELKPKQYQTLFHLSKIYFTQNNFNEAIKYIELGITENIFTPNYYIYNWYAICLREVRGDYKACIDFLNKSIHVCELEVNGEKKANNFRYVQKELIISYIKQGLWEQVDISTDLFQVVFEEIIARPDLIITNMPTQKKGIIINWLLSQLNGNYFEDYNSALNYLTNHKIKCLIEQGVEVELFNCLNELLDNNFILSRVLYDENEKSILSKYYFELLKKRLSFVQFRYVFLHSVMFCKDENEAFSKLEDYFNHHAVDESYKLFKEFQRINNNLGKYNFVDVLLKTENLCYLINYKDELLEYAKIYFQRSNYEKAEFLYLKSIEYLSDFQSHFEYSVFLLKTCQFSRFIKQIDKSIEVFSKERDYDEKEASKLVKGLFKGLLSNLNYEFFPFLHSNYQSLIRKENANIEIVFNLLNIEFKTQLIRSFLKNDPYNKKLIEQSAKIYVHIGKYGNAYTILRNFRHSTKNSELISFEKECKKTISQFNLEIEILSGAISDEINPILNIVNKDRNLNDISFSDYSNLAKYFYEKNQHSFTFWLLRKARLIDKKTFYKLKLNIPYEICKNKCKYEITSLIYYLANSTYQIGKYEIAFNLFVYLSKFYCDLEKNIKHEYINNFVNSSNYLQRTKISSIEDVSVLLAIGKKYFDIKDYNTAKYYFDLVISQKVDEISLTFSKYQKAKILYLTSNYGESLSLLKTIHFSLDIEDKEFLCDIIWLKAQLYIALEIIDPLFLKDINDIYRITLKDKVLNIKEALIQSYISSTNSHYEYESLYSKSLKLKKNIRFASKNNVEMIKSMYYELIDTLENSYILKPNNYQVAFDYVNALFYCNIHYQYKVSQKTLDLLKINFLFDEKTDYDFNFYRYLGNIFKDHTDPNTALFFYNCALSKCINPKEYFIISNNIVRLHLDCKIQGDNKVDLLTLKQLNDNAEKYALDCWGDLRVKYLKLVKENTEKIECLMSSTQS